MLRNVCKIYCLRAFTKMNANVKIIMELELTATFAKPIDKATSLYDFNFLGKNRIVLFILYSLVQ